MAVCVYDNPFTMRREAYHEKELKCFISAGLMGSNQFHGHKDLPFMINAGRWQSGRVRGHLHALPDIYRKAIEEKDNDTD